MLLLRPATAPATAAQLLLLPWLIVCLHPPPPRLPTHTSPTPVVGVHEHEASNALLLALVGVQGVGASLKLATDSSSTAHSSSTRTAQHTQPAGVKTKQLHLIFEGCECECEKMHTALSAHIICSCIALTCCIAKPPTLHPSLGGTAAYCCPCCGCCSSCCCCSCCYCCCSPLTCRCGRM